MLHEMLHEHDGSLDWAMVFMVGMAALLALALLVVVITGVLDPIEALWEDVLMPMQSVNLLIVCATLATSVLMICRTMFAIMRQRHRLEQAQLDQQLWERAEKTRLRA